MSRAWCRGRRRWRPRSPRLSPGDPNCSIGTRHLRSPARLLWRRGGNLPSVLADDLRSFAAKERPKPSSVRGSKEGLPNNKVSGETLHKLTIERYYSKYWRSATRQQMPAQRCSCLCIVKPNGLRGHFNIESLLSLHDRTLLPPAPLSLGDDRVARRVGVAGPSRRALSALSATVSVPRGRLDSSTGPGPWPNRPAAAPRAAARLPPPPPAPRPVATSSGPSPPRTRAADRR